MKKILFKEINENNDCQLLYYIIKRKQLSVVFKFYNTKDIYKLRFAHTKKTISLDKESTERVLSVIPEEKLIEYFGNDSGFLMFQNYCTENKLNYKYDAVMKK